MWICIRQGLLWLLIATIAEVPSTVRLGYSFALFLFAHRNFSPQVLMILNLNGSLSFSPIYQKTGIDRILFG
jgi:hypothetical protein